MNVLQIPSMSSTKLKLFYFTLSYPWGIGEEWKRNELMELRHHFRKVTVVPYSHDGNMDDPKPVPEGVECLRPLFPASNYQVSKRRVFEILRSRHRRAFLAEFFGKRVFLDRGRARSWLDATGKTLDILKHPTIGAVLREADEDTVFYFYWGKGICQIMPFVKDIGIRSSFVRMHRFDLFEHVNDGYIPYRKALLESIDTAAPVSQTGKDHLDALYPFARDKVKVFRCGTLGNGVRSPFSTDGRLRMVSCSYLSPVKRVHLMVESLRLLGPDAEWHHVGDGGLRNELEDLARRHGLGERFFFHGMMDTRDIMGFLTSHPFDFFVNASSSEGVPISIMEAFAAGIPVLATDVGGTSEIVDGEVGALLPADLTPEGLADEIRRLRAFDDTRKQAMRTLAYERYETRCNASVLARELAEYLTA